MSDKVWSNRQQAIFDFPVRESNLVIMARAGTGKTTTIVELGNRIRASEPRASIIFCAFNKAIVTELTERLKNVDVKTLHSVGFAMVRSENRHARVDEGKGKDIAREICRRYNRDDLFAALMKLVGLGKNTLAQSLGDCEGLISAYSILQEEDHEGNGDTSALLAEMAMDAMRESAANTSRVDFDDMVWLPWMLDLRSGRYDYVIVDECQDMNAAQLWLARALMKPNTGRAIVVGDDRQAIYGFRGADAQAMGRMTSELSATVLPLDITYRCPKAVVAMANAIVPDYYAAESAPEGVVANKSQNELESEAKVGDFILSRKNAPLMPLALGFISRGVPAAIAGKDIGKALGVLIKKSKAKDIPALFTWLDKFQEAEERKFQAMDSDKADRLRSQLSDKIACIHALSEGCETIECIKERLETMFTDSDPRTKVMLSSVHKAKGLERETVWVLPDTFRVGKGTEEDNLWYVALTRSKANLYLVAGIS